MKNVGHHRRLCEQKPKVSYHEPLSHLNALLQYASNFKLGQIKFTILQDGTHTGQWRLQAVIGEDAMSEGEGDTRDKAIEVASIMTLALFDPNGKSLAANISHPDSSQLTKLARDVETAAETLRTQATQRNLQQQQHQQQQQQCPISIATPLCDVYCVQGCDGACRWCVAG